MGVLYFSRKSCGKSDERKKLESMKLLMITQVVDEEHPIQGFATTWIKKLSEHLDYLYVLENTIYYPRPLWKRRS